MNILYIAHRMPYPPDKGDKIRTFHQIRELGKQNCVYLVCLVDDRRDLIYSRELGQYCTAVATFERGKSVMFTQVVGSLLRDVPLSVGAFFNRALAEKVETWLHEKEIDIILVSSSAVAQYVVDVHDIPRVVDFMDLDSEKWRAYAAYRALPAGWVYRLEAARLARHERLLARTFDHCVFISDAENAMFRRHCPDGRVSVVSNGVDVDYFQRNGALEGEHPTIVFTGVMNYFPNIDAVEYFCEEILSIVRRSVPNVRFMIVGREPSRRVRKLARHEGVVVTGAVLDIRPYLMNAMIAVAPFRIARGVQNKVLEAMSMGLPVVGTSQAFQGIGVTEEDGIVVANDLREFAEVVAGLLRCSPAHRRAMGRRGRLYIERHHRWEDQGAILEKLLVEAVERRANRTKKLMPAFQTS